MITIGSGLYIVYLNDFYFESRQLPVDEVLKNDQKLHYKHRERVYSLSHSFRGRFFSCITLSSILKEESFGYK